MLAYQKNELKNPLYLFFFIKTKKVQDLAGSYNDRKHYTRVPYQSQSISYKRDVQKPGFFLPMLSLFRLTSDKDLSQQHKKTIYPSQKEHNQILRPFSTTAPEKQNRSGVS